MISSFQQTVPPTTPTVIEDEGAGQGGGTSQVFSSEGGYLIVKNTGTQALAVGGPNDSPPLYPLAPSDPAIRIDVGPNDKPVVVSTTASNGQITVLRVDK